VGRNKKWEGKRKGREGKRKAFGLLCSIYRGNINKTVR